EVPSEQMPQFQAVLNDLIRQEAGARSSGTVAGRYEEEKKRVNPATVTNAAKAIMSDASMTSVFLNGRSQAFKDAVTDEITRRGGDVNKLSEGARQMAEMAKDILPTMDQIVADAQKVNALGLMGPIAGRWQDFLTGTIGAADIGTKTPQDAQLVARF